MTYEKCMQRMKCPVNRKEECSEECQAGKERWFNELIENNRLIVGNTEEEVEEHLELTIGEDRNSLQKRPKPKLNSDQPPTIKTDF